MRRAGGFSAILVGAVLSACGGGGAPEVDPARGPAAADAGFEDAEVGFGQDAAERVQHVLAGVDGTLVVRRLSTGETLRHAKERAATPAPTAKRASGHA